MDHEAFDRVARVLGMAGSRRAALGALLGAGVAAAAETAVGKKKQRKSKKDNGKGKSKPRNERANDRDKNRRANQKTQAPPADGAVAMEASCASPGPSSNLNGCNFSGDDLDGFDLSSSNMKNANFRNASLCGTDLSSSTLTNADFRNANLTRADLHSSGCNGIKTNGATFCQTITCNGTVRNDDCPAGAAVCCDAGECEQRICRTTECRDSGCFYGEQINNQPGTLCETPQVCCNGNCCTAGQKCCGSTCIDEDACCTDGEEKCPPGAECVAGECEVTCIALDQACTSAAECCGPGPRDCRERLFEPSKECCIANGGACVQPPGQNNSCCAGPDFNVATCLGGVCCNRPGERCSSAAECCQTPATQVCQSVSTCGGGIDKVCCQPAGSPCGDQCDCCGGSCVNGACSAT